MRFIGLCTALGVLILALGCSPSFTVKDDFDPDAQFDRYFTWYWVQNSPTQKAVAEGSQNVRDLDAHIRGLIETEMRKKGLTKVETNPDIEMLYHIGLKGDFGTANWDVNYLDQIKNAEVYQSSGAVIIIDIIDARTHRLIWRGQGTGAVNVDPTPEMVKNNTTRAITKILDKYPPK
jgi:hypothetical protein